MPASTHGFSAVGLVILRPLGRGFADLMPILCRRPATALRVYPEPRNRKFSAAAISEEDISCAKYSFKASSCSAGHVLVRWPLLLPRGAGIRWPPAGLLRA